MTARRHFLDALSGLVNNYYIDNANGEEHMKVIKLIKRDENKAIGIFQEHSGRIFATTWCKSKDFKTVAGAERWLAKQIGKAV